jgi:hypothetical protein
MGNRCCLNCAEFWNRERPGREQFQQHRLERVINLVDLVDEKNTGTFLLDGFKQGTCHEVRPTGYLALDFCPVRSLLALAHQQDIELLQAAIVLANRLLFIDSLIALETQQRRVVCAGLHPYLNPISLE